MSSYFSFRFKEQEADPREAIAIYCAGKPSRDSIVKKIKNDINVNPVCKKIKILVLEDHFQDVEEIFSDSSFIAEATALVGLPCSSFEKIRISSRGEFFDGKQIAISEKTRDEILAAGALNIFKIRGGLIEANGNYHFRKPSGQHCDKFIRTSNLLVSGAEVSFLALSILPRLTSEIRRVYVDSSSISYLISTAIIIAKVGASIAIESFESYSVFKKTFDFVVDERSLIVISATTSGGLAKDLIQQQQFGQHQILTIFHTGLPQGQAGLFNISSHINEGIRSFAASVCPMCSRESRVINIAGDQFLPETPLHEPLLIKKTDFSAARAALFKEFATKTYLGWNQPVDANASDKEHFFFDIEKLITCTDEVKFKDDLQKKLNMAYSRHVNKVISLNDIASFELAKIACKDAEDTAPIRIADVDLTDTHSWQSVLVIAAAIRSGRELLSISRKLRSLPAASTITYFVGLSKLPNLTLEAQLRKDLEMGGNRLVIVQKFPMPRIKESQITLWQREYSFLKKYSSTDPFASDVDVKLPDILSSRFNVLSGHPSSDQLFLNSANGDVLKLRPTFAFWEGLGLRTNEASQADVYWTVQSVLHDLRTKTDGQGLASSYHSTLISPACFDRFNDGVIQASFIRSALPSELNYALDDQFSRRMADIIISAIKNIDNEQGEAALEFLMALVLGQINLCQKHVLEICELAETPLHDTVAFLIGKLAAQE